MAISANGHSIKERLEDVFLACPDEILRFRSRIENQGNGIKKPEDLINTEVSNGELEKILRSSQEAVVISPEIAIAVRLRPGVWEYIVLNLTQLNVSQLTPSVYLKFKERAVEGWISGSFELDLKPFNESIPQQTLPNSIGNGLEFLNRFLASKMFNDEEILHQLFEFLKSHNYNGQSLMLNEKVQDLNGLRSVLRQAEEYLLNLSPETPYSKFEALFQEIGLERGWGETSGRAHEIINELLILVEGPDAYTVQRFLGKVPMIFNVVILSPHGYFAQDNVLGYPDTGDQVVYILDQVPAMEHEMLQRLKQQDLILLSHEFLLWVTRLLPDAVGTTCGERLEKVYNTKYSHILRVPFRNGNGILKKWISRFDVWPYMETFTEDAAKEIVGELGAKPDLIIGNYSEGNLVASLLARKFGSIQKIRKIIVNGKSGFHIDPNNGEQSAETIGSFFEKCKEDPSYWDSMSDGGLKRILEKYTWKIYSEKVMDMASVYGFWKHVSKKNGLEKAKQRYLEMFYELVYRNAAERVPVAVDE